MGKVKWKETPQEVYHERILMFFFVRHLIMFGLAIWEGDSKRTLICQLYPEKVPESKSFSPWTLWAWFVRFVLVSDPVFLLSHPVQIGLNGDCWLYALPYLVNKMQWVTVTFWNVIFCWFPDERQWSKGSAPQIVNAAKWIAHHSAMFHLDICEVENLLLRTSHVWKKHPTNRSISVVGWVRGLQNGTLYETCQSHSFWWCIWRVTPSLAVASLQTFP